MISLSQLMFDVNLLLLDTDELTCLTKITTSQSKVCQPNDSQDFVSWQLIASDHVGSLCQLVITRFNLYISH